MSDQLSDKNKENEVIANATPTVGTGAGAILPPESRKAKPAAPEMSKGEKVFEWGLYKGMYYWFNLGISMAITDYFLHGKGKNFFNRGVKNLTNKLMSSTRMNEDWAEWLAKIGLGTFSLNSGGNLLLIPLKLGEDNKRPIVHWLNKKFGVDQTAPDGHEETADEIHIVNDIPKKSWMNVIMRRLLSNVITISSGFAVDAAGRKKLATPIVNENGKIITHQGGQARLEDAIVDGTEKLFAGNAVGRTIEKNPWIHRYLHYGALDSIYTLMSSTTMEVTNGSKHVKMPKEIDDTNDPPGEEVLDEIVVRPRAAKASEDLKSKKPVPMESHTDKALTANEPSLGLAP